MTTEEIIKMNIHLSAKLADFISKNPSLLKQYSGYSYVVFTLSNTELNAFNEKITQELLEEGKKVVKAKKTNNKELPWEFSSVS